MIADWRDKQRKKAVKNWFNFCKAVTGVAQAKWRGFDIAECKRDEMASVHE